MPQGRARPLLLTLHRFPADAPLSHPSLGQLVGGSRSQEAGAPSWPQGLRAEPWADLGWTLEARRLLVFLL